MAGSTCAGIAPSPFAQLQADGQTIARLGGDVDSATTLSADTSYLLTSQLFISASLTIPPGTTIYAMPTGQAPGGPTRPSPPPPPRWIGRSMELTSSRLLAFPHRRCRPGHRR